MGQPIQVLDTTRLGEVVLIHTDRSITGQDGSVYTASEETDDEFPGRLAAEIFGGIGGVTHVFVASNEVVVGRQSAWSDAEVERVSGIVSDFFVFYDEEAPEGASS